LLAQVALQVMVLRAISGVVVCLSAEKIDVLDAARYILFCVRKPSAYSTRVYLTADVG
jgi:hypothetical protein